MTDPARDPRVDAYIAAREPFARPILEALRARVHAACPGVIETIKWSMPFFDYHGRPLANMAGFKAHASFGFWRHGEVAETGTDPKAAMGRFGRLTSVDDLPPEAEFATMVTKAAAMIGAAPAAPRPRKHPKPEIRTPAELTDVFRLDAAARGQWEALAPSCRREYAEWIEDAKRPETRSRRVATALAQIAEGRKLNWKYEKAERPGSTSASNPIS